MKSGVIQGLVSIKDTPLLGKSKDIESTYQESGSKQILCYTIIVNEAGIQNLKACSEIVETRPELAYEVFTAPKHELGHQTTL